MKRFLGGIAAVFSICVVGFFVFSGLVQAVTGSIDPYLQGLIDQNKKVQALNSQIQDKAGQISSLDQKIDVYNQAIDQKQTEEFNLENEIAVIDEDMNRTATQIEKTQLELDKLNLELHGLDLKIERTTNDVGVTKDRVGETLRLLYQSEQKSAIEITFSVNTLSEFFSQLTYQKTLQASLQSDLDNLKQLQIQLDQQHGEAVIKQKDASQAAAQLEAQQQSLAGEKTFKDNLLEKTASDEDKFQQLVKDAQSEETAVNAEIDSLESKAQAQIDALRQAAEDKRNKGQPLTDDEESLLVGDVVFSWPIDSREITCGFHCTGYPFAKWFPHTGLDIRTSAGTPVKATASGYVAIARQPAMNDDGSSALAYVSIDHNQTYSSLYLHLSAVYVSPGQYVHRGEVIGLSGGLPGLPGSGAFTTGAHLHFEVRENGIPTDPLQFLP